MGPDELQRLVDEHPDWALDYADLLTPTQFDFCIRKKPGVALFHEVVCPKLSVEQFDFCCREDPSSAICCLRMLSPEQIEFCCEIQPARALTTLLLFHPPHLKTPFKLTKAQIATCCRRAPAEALQFMAHMMEMGLSDELLRAAPAVDFLNEALFKECAEAEPWEAIRFSHGRLTDDDLVRHIAGCGKEIRHLLVSEPALVLRLSRLSDRLDQEIAEAVREAIVLAI